MIEASNPDLQFDWTRILKGQVDPDTGSAPELRNARGDRDRKAVRPEPERRARPAEPEPVPDTPAATTEKLPLPPEEPTTPAHARLGSEGLARLRARYAETLARITERIPDAEQQSQLKALAERLNPDAWVTETDVHAGIESYEATFESLRGAIGSRRRSPRPDPAGPLRAGEGE